MCPPFTRLNLILFALASSFTRHNVTLFPPFFYFTSRAAQAASNLDVDDAVADCEPLPRQELHTDHLAGVFRNFSAFKDGRGALQAVEDGLFLNVCASLRKGCDARRVAISECARNIALDPATANKPMLPQLIAALTLRCKFARS